MSLSRELRVQMRTIRALVLRDIMMRYGRGNLGFLWVLIEPMILTVGVMVIWSQLKGEREHGVQIIAFVLTGYVPLTLWRHMSGAGVMTVRRNATLMYHRNVTVLDVFLSRMILEFASVTAALIIITSTALAVDLIEPIADYGRLMEGWFAMGALAFGSALVICGLTESSEVWERFIAPFQYLQLPVSGFFFMLEWLPTKARELAWYVPTVHCYQAVRAGYFGEGTPAEYDIWYPFAWALGLTVLGLPLLDYARRNIHYG